MNRALQVLFWLTLLPVYIAPICAEEPATDSAAASPIPILSNEEALARLPLARVGNGAVLPLWARATVDSLPRTTAAMLELDAQHRVHSPLGEVLAGKIRWTVAHANRCEYIQAQAAADLARAGVSAHDIEALATDTPSTSVAESDAITFAHKLTVDANEVTDEEVETLIAIFGEHKVVAIVLLVAYGNFQDRLILALQIKSEPDGPLPPPAIQFAGGAPAPIVPARVPPDNPEAPEVPERVDDPQWQDLDFEVLKKNLSEQQQRPGRIRVPHWEDVASGLPPNQRPKNPVRIRWSLVCRGYQPDLANGWAACMRSFAEESQQDRVFEESLFWVITRTIHCFY